MLRELLASLALAILATPAAADCGRLFVSGYYSTVHVYDACDGRFLRELAPRDVLKGAQAVREHEGKLYVVAEGYNSIVRFDAASLEYVDTFIQVGGNPGITGIAFGPDGDVYLGGYNSDSVLRFDGSTGAAKGSVVSGNRALDGTDNGLVFGPDGKLYIPGFDSNNVLRWDPASGRTEVFIASRSGGLSRTRGILFEPDGEGVLVSSEGSGQVLRYRRDGSFDRVLASFDFGPNGIDFGPAGELLVTGFGGDRVERIDPRSGQRLGTRVERYAGGLSGATFLTVQAASGGIDTAQVGSQYWLTGAGTPQGLELQMDLLSASGASFGDDFDPAAIQVKRWGSLRVQFTGCDSAILTWSSSGEDSAGFGDGGYPLSRLAATRASTRCNSEGLAAQTQHDWMAGTWYGGPGRSGEGLFLDALDSGLVLGALFTHRPATD